MSAAADSASKVASRRAEVWFRLAAYHAPQWVGVAGLMFAFSLGAIQLEQWSGRLVVGWPMNAVALACLLRSRGSRWPYYVALFVLANLPAPMAHGKPLLVAFSLALTNGVQVWGCAAVLRRLLGRRIDLSRYRDLWIFSLTAALGLPLSSILLLTLVQPQHRSLIESLPRLAHWAVGASLSYLLVTPAIFAFTPKRLLGSIRHVGVRRVALVLIGYTAAVVVISTQAYGELRFLLIAALLWLTFQLGTMGVVLGLIVQVVAITICVALGVGIGASQAGASDHLMQLQLGLVLNALCAYPVAAALAHRWRLGQSLVKTNVSLRQAQNLTRIAEQTGGIGYARFDVVTGQYVYSDHMARMLGGLEGDVHPEDLARAEKLRAHAIATGEDYDNFLRIRSATGEWRMLRGRTTCELDADGKVAALVGVVIDVTDLELADQALRASEARYRLLAETSNDAILLTDLEGRLTYVSPALFAMTGHSSDTLTHELLHPGDAVWADQRIAALHGDPEQPDIGDFTFRVRHREGRWLWLEMRSAPLRDPDTGKLTGLMQVARDITERKTMEAELERKCADAEAANHAKSEFLANMSHEIRTPLNGVMGVAGALGQTELSTSQREMVSIIEASAQTLETLLSDILDLARIEAGKMELRPEPFDLAASVNACSALFDPVAQAKGLELDVSIAPNALGVYVGDAARIRQIVSNLLGNAVKFTQAGGITLTVNAQHSDRSSELRFDVRDTGIGFDEETKARLFLRFEQADGSVTRRFGGSGLGLSISRSLAEAMGGRLEADAKPGEGAVFSLILELPRCEGAMDPSWENPEPEPGCDSLVGLRVLLAEDHPINRRVVELILSSAGVNLTCVENGRDAVEAFRNGEFDLVLMDMQMPVMDGLAAIGVIRGLETAAGSRPTPIHVLTANAMPEHVSASLAAGADGHLSKPIMADALLERVVEAAGARHSL